MVGWGKAFCGCFKMDSSLTRRYLCEVIMDIVKTKRLLAVFFAIFWIFAIGIYLIANEQFRYSAVTGSAPTPSYDIGEITDDLRIDQQMIAPSDCLSSLELFFGTYDRSNNGTLAVSLENGDGALLLQVSMNVSDIPHQSYLSIPFAQRTDVVKGEALTLHINSQGCGAGNAVTLYAGDAFQEGMLKYQVNGQTEVGTLCAKLNGYNYLTFYKTYWVVIAAIFIILVVYAYYCWKGFQNGRQNLLTLVYSLVYRYGFLLKQLVSRDFKTKYKRSSLGMAWSFLNPLLTMCVQYVVFSSLFKGGTPNYPVYLLTGILFFNFFSEAVSLGMTSIVLNASLIKKVYVPKYIYPFSRTISSLINFVFALMPLGIVIVLTRTAVRPAILLLLFDILCFLLFVTGFTLLMSTAMTFFQDTQFLWGIISMIWQYLTPIFYTESIIPKALLPIYRLNPMYQFITFARTCIIEGISPPPSSYFLCLISGILVFLLGLFVFKKNQDKFVLYL